MIVLYYLADLPVEQVAHELRVPVGTVKARLARARGALASSCQAIHSARSSQLPGTL